MAAGTPSPVRSSRRLGRYQTIARIAVGGMAEVYLARQVGPMDFVKLVVIKTIHPHLVQERELVAMLLDEARISAQIKHPHIVDIYDLGEEEGTYFIAMEYLAGESLADVIVTNRRSQPPMGIYSLAAIVADCADALHAAHTWTGHDGRNLGLVHRDVTPGNIIVLYTGDTKLVDFGIAKARGRAVVTGTDNRLKGKIGYVAPEQLSGAEADVRCDVYSLGVVLWEALTSRRLFWAPNEATVVQAILQAEVPPPSRWTPTVPHALDAICLRALQRDPLARYASAGAFADDLRAFLRDANYHSHRREVTQFMATAFAARRATRDALVREAATADVPARVPDLPALRAKTVDEILDAPVPVVVGSHGTGKTRSAYEDDDSIIEVIDESPDGTAPAGLAAPAITNVGRQTGPAWLPWALGGGAIAVATVVGFFLLRDGAHPATGATAAAAAEEKTAASVPGPTTPTPAEVDDSKDVAVVDAQPAVDPARPAGSLGERGRKPRSHDRDRATSTSPPLPAGTAANPQLLYKEGLRMQVAGDTNGAVERFKAAITANKSFAPAYRGLGLALEKQGRSERAAKAYKTYLELAPSAADAATIRERLKRLE